MANGCLLAGNSAANGADYAGNVVASDCLFQTQPTGTLSGSNNLVNLDPLLDPKGLQNNGGPTETIALQSGSPAIGRAASSTSLLTDQRGYVLPAGSSLAIGSYQALAVPDTTPPSAELRATDVNSSNANTLNPYTFSIIYADNVAVDQVSLVGAGITVEPPGGGPALDASVLSITPSGLADSLGDAATETVVYQVTPTGGNWSGSPSGTYSVILNGAPVTDLAGNRLVAGTLGTFLVNVASQPPPSRPAPGVVLTKLVRRRGSLTEIVVVFSAAMNPASIDNLGNYTLLDAGSDHVFGNKNDRVLTLKGVSYSSSTDSVTISLKKPVNLSHSLRLTLDAQPPGGLQSTSGQFLNASVNGRPGSNFLTFLGKPPKASKPKPSRSVHKSISRTETASGAAQERIAGRGRRPARGFERSRSDSSTTGLVTAQGMASANSSAIDALLELDIPLEMNAFAGGTAGRSRIVRPSR